MTPAEIVLAVLFLGVMTGWLGAVVLGGRDGFWWALRRLARRRRRRQFERERKAGR
jgi:hypothetical protein